MSKTLFLQFDKPWTGEELDNVVTAIDDSTGDDVEIVAVPDSIEYMDEDQIESFIDLLGDKLNDD